MKINYIFIIFLISFTLEKESGNKVYELDDFFNLIYRIEISEETSKKIINDLKEKLERYIYLDILKAPPQPSRRYHNQIDLINELDDVNTSKRPLYDFYRDIKIIINKCQDFHLDIDISKKFNSEISLQNSLFISPVAYFINNNDVYSFVNYEHQNYFDANLINKIRSNFDKRIISIKGVSPLSYILNFNGDFKQLKSLQAQFIYNQYNVAYFQVSSIPFNKTTLTDITIKYEDSTYVTFSYKVLHNSNLIELLTQYYDISETELNNLSYRKPFLQPKLKTEEFLKDQKLQFITWDSEFETDAIKCKVDNISEINVLLNHKFSVSNVENGIKFIDNCFNAFGQNKYPIMIIENLNSGGSLKLADYLLSYVNIKKVVPLYGSMRYNDNVKENIAPVIEVKRIETCNAIRASEFFKIEPKEDIYTSNSEQKIYHKRTEIFDLSVFNKYKINQYRKSNILKNPTDIIIFTDGYSYSAASIFIKETQLKGGAIIVGFGGNPLFKSFDSSQGPSSVKRTNISSDDLGFSLSYTYIEMFDKNDKESGQKIPLEFQINPIDERAAIYSQYLDKYYEDFVSIAKSYINYYQDACNPENKKLLKITDQCVFSDKHMHGGYECGDDGKWSNKCIASYCDSDYYYDEINNVCKEICKDPKHKSNSQYNKVNLIYFVIGLIFLIYSY